MYVTNGFRDNGSLVWLEFVYRRWAEVSGRVETMTKPDYIYYQEMSAKIKANPTRFGDEIHYIG